MTHGDPEDMSAFSLVADAKIKIARGPRSAMNGLVHRSKLNLFDHIIGPSEQMVGHIHAQGLGGFEIDY
jgi:hypothetical protein